MWPLLDTGRLLEATAPVRGPVPPAADRQPGWAISVLLALTQTPPSDSRRKLLLFPYHTWSFQKPPFEGTSVAGAVHLFLKASRTFYSYLPWGPASWKAGPPESSLGLGMYSGGRHGSV